MQIRSIFQYKLLNNQLKEPTKLLFPRAIFLRFILNVCLLLCFNNNMAQSFLLKEFNEFGANPGNLRMFSFNGRNQNDTGKHPLVMVLHGCTQQAEDIARITGWNKLAQLHGFVVVYPQQLFMNNPSNCFNWFNKKDIERNGGECQSIASMLDFAIQNLNVDSEKVYITGVSAGAGLALAMAASYPEKFNAVATIAGVPYHLATGLSNALSVMRGKFKLDAIDWLSATKKQHPAFVGSYPLLICFQGEDDPIVHPNNLNLLVQQWCALQNIDTIPDQIHQNYQGISSITQHVFVDSVGREKVIAYLIKNLGHKILVHPGQKPEEGGARELFSIDIGFHATYEVARLFKLVKK